MHKSEQQERKNRVQQLENLVERYTRSERHLEQHADIASEEKIKQAEALQEERKELMNSLENKIAFGDGSGKDDLENLKRNYEFAEGYLNHNAEHMSSKDLNALEEKQKNRENLINFLE